MLILVNRRGRRRFTQQLAMRAREKTSYADEVFHCGDRAEKNDMRRNLQVGEAVDWCLNIS
ncbi:MAG: hypothetical protein Q7U75_03040 [Desulfobacterales bacterium]|jgi:hypothetical protein|nr:hypothetical protein [Desulfobacterales bacterium]